MNGGVNAQQRVCSLFCNMNNSDYEKVRARSGQQIRIYAQQEKNYITNDTIYMYSLLAIYS